MCHILQITFAYTFFICSCSLYARILFYKANATVPFVDSRIIREHFFLLSKTLRTRDFRSFCLFSDVLLSKNSPWCVTLFTKLQLAVRTLSHKHNSFLTLITYFLKIFISEFYNELLYLLLININNSFISINF